MNSSYYGCITDIRQLHRFHSDNVRWLDPSVDYDLIEEYLSYFNVHSATDTYFGISLKRIQDDYSIDEDRNGRLCGFVADGRILSLAGVEVYSPTEWKLCAVSSHPAHRNKGHSKATCSFVAQYILEANKRAICETNITNLAMQSVLRQIGMTQYFLGRTGNC
ncbi:MAG: hypothetical protein HOH43_09480 [Candidatus Latescibacteria bacterium]|nr:hypothetical protein [Candidatus Latescibacterota bacterium]MBT7914295.1 hypothetical protein [Candidatus Bathyarchaeota archaeon]